MLRMSRFSSALSPAACNNLQPRRTSMMNESAIDSSSKGTLTSPASPFLEPACEPAWPGRWLGEDAVAPHGKAGSSGGSSRPGRRQLGEVLQAAPAAAFPPALLPFWVIGEAKVLRHSRLLVMKSNDGLHELLMNKRLSHKKVPDRLRRRSAEAEMLLAGGGCVW